MHQTSPAQNWSPGLVFLPIVSKDLQLFVFLTIRDLLFPLKTIHKSPISSPIASFPWSTVVRIVCKLYLKKKQTEEKTLFKSFLNRDGMLQTVYKKS